MLRLRRTIIPVAIRIRVFQWAPTLGGECYVSMTAYELQRDLRGCFNGHPPLGVNATYCEKDAADKLVRTSFNGHPPLGVNATSRITPPLRSKYFSRFNGHPPLGVNATES